MRPRLINRVSEDEAAGQIGAKKVELLRMFRKWLYGIAEHEEMEFRAAPSVIARSEAEMFGLSSPRFAFRTDFADNGFVNARRLERTAANLNDDAIAHVLKSRSQSCVADCLLAPPLRLAEYRMVQVELGRACGEGKPIVGVPYLKHMLFGGGMCCQAAAYMVLALLDRAGLPRLIPGVADLSAIANRANDEVNIDGLTVGAALRLFRSDEIGLSASWEMTPQDDETHLNHLTTALRAYVCSGFPPILLVDLGLLLATTHEGKTLLDANDYPKKAQGTEMGPATAPSTPDACDDVLSERHRPHAIVVYGCHPKRDRFVVGDPATAPFLEADVRALAAIRKKSSATVTASPQRAHEGVQYIAATPKGVELPLLCDLGRFAPASSSNENSLFPGLIHLANQWLRAGPAPGSPKFPGMPRYRDTPGSLGSFRLLRLTDDVETATMLDPEWLSDRARIAVRADLSLWLKPGWYWVQRVEAPDDSNQWAETLWIWDASLQPRPLERDAGPERYFVGLHKPESLRRDLLEALEKVVSDTPRIRTPLAIECEPGQYFLVQDWTSLKDIAYELDANKTLRSRVGINLDVSHFKLAGIDPTWIRHDQKVRDRIVHAHLSGSHRCSHFGDLPPLGLMDEAESQADFVRREYEPWIDLLRTIAGDVRDNGLPFSGHVSLELEAAKCVGDVRSGLEQLIDLL